MKKKTIDSTYHVCPVCKNDTPADKVYCVVCGAELERHDEEREIEWEIVRTVNTVVEAELIAGRLRSYDIPAIVLSQVDSTRNFTVGELAIAKVFVPQFALEEAANILAVDEDEFGDNGIKDMGDEDE
ncbi:MAG: DUF2007 domain-containing protein [Chlorobi bacterium]|nr:DUF2007 domain-containing protein [Chlorobiota bacterium]